MIDLNQILMPLVFLLLFLIAALTIIIIIQSLRTKGALSRGLSLSLFLVTLPKSSPKAGEAQKPEKEIIGVMEQFYAGLSSVRAKGSEKFFYGAPYFALEIAVPHVGEEISFYVGAPKKLEEFVEKQIYGIFPSASVKKVEDYNIFNPYGASVGSQLSLSKNSALPLKTYLALETDPLNAVTIALSKLREEGEGGALQILLRPAGSQWKNLALKAAKEMQKGADFESALAKARGGFFRFLVESLIGAKEKKDAEPIRITPLQEQVIKAIEEKTNKVEFEVNVRLMASAANLPRAEEILKNMEGAFTQFAHPNFNNLKSARPQGRGLRNLIYQFSFRLFDDYQKIILNTEELTSVFHFPVGKIETPKVQYLKAKLASPPVNMPGEGLILGKNFFRGVETVARMAPEDRRRHLYVIGQTGTGKSHFIENLVIQDIDAGRGVALLDPHGDSIEKILGLIPRERVDDVILFEPFDMERPMGLNMLEARTPAEMDFAIQEMIAIFYKLFPPEIIGPLFEHNMRNAMLTLMADPDDPGTIVEIPRIFTDEKFVRYKLQKVTDPTVRAFWEQEMAQTSPQARSELLGYLISKVGRFVENTMMRNIIGQPRSAFNFRQIMDEQKILLVNLNKGKTGEVNSSLIGLILISKLQMAAFARADVPQEQRKDFYLYADEFQNFTTDSIATILSEARKYRLDLIIGHQFIAQLQEKIRDAVFGNVGSLVSFRVGVDDAEYLAKQLEPVFDANDLINLDNFNAYVKLMINGQISVPFNMITYPGRPSSLELAKSIREISRLKYGRDRAMVEREIFERSQFGKTAPPPAFDELNR